jgi:phenylpyruvate tautomerase PptA (4-oxalocrotonate tautomerase family)
MPLVRISLHAGKSDAYATQLVADPTFMGMERSTDFVLIQIFLSRGRTTATKQALYRSIAGRLAKSLGLRSDDVMIVLTEIGLEDWSFGRGEAQYVLNPPAWAGNKQEHFA